MDLEEETKSLLLRPLTSSPDGTPHTRPRQKSTVNPFLLPSFCTSVREEEEEEKERATEDSQRKGRPGLTFKTVARAVTQQRKLSSLLKDIIRQSDDHTRAKGFIAKTDNSQERLSFNVNAFKSHIQSCGALPEEIKIVLRKPSWNRTEEEVEAVLQIVKRMKGFQRYPMYVKRELAKVLYYDVFNQGRVIIKQGHIGISFYFIASGSVVVQRVEEDRITGEKHNQIVGDMAEGDSFGELALLHDIKRTATIICKERTEFLRVDKQDFNEVLRMSHQIEYERKLSVLTLQPVFKEWTPNEIKQTVAHTKLREYPPNMIIIGDIKHYDDCVYFIRTGKCKVVREMELFRKVLPSGKSRLILPPINASDNDRSSRKLVRKFLTVRILKQGDYFGVGEDLMKTYIITIGRVHCVLINHIIFCKRDRGRFMEEMRKELIQTFPTRQEAFKSYKEERNWKQYKKKCIDEVVSRRRKSHPTTFEDVPLVVRRENSYFLNSND